MRAEGWTMGILAGFFALVTPMYWVVSKDITGTSALVLTTCLAALITFYLALVARRVGPRPEDRRDGEIADAAGEVGFFSPYSWWPLIAAFAMAVCMLGVVFGWWLFLIGAAVGVVGLLGWVFEYYRGEHAH